MGLCRRWGMGGRRVIPKTDMYHNINSSPAPAAPPKNIFGYNVSEHEIRVFWEDVPFRDVNGIMLGYRVFFHETSDEVFNQTVEAPTMNVTLGFLRPFTFYSIQVLAFTIKGSGPKSPPIIIRTEEEGKEDEGGDGGGGISCVFHLLYFYSGYLRTFEK